MINCIIQCDRCGSIQAYTDAKEVRTAVLRILLEDTAGVILCPSCKQDKIAVMKEIEKEKDITQEKMVKSFMEKGKKK